MTMSPRAQKGGNGEQGRQQKCLFGSGTMKRLAVVTLLPPSLLLPCNPFWLPTHSTTAGGVLLNIQTLFLKSFKSGCRLPPPFRVGTCFESLRRI